MQQKAFRLMKIDFSGSKRFITLPAIDKRIPLGAYIKAVKWAKQNPGAVFETGLTTWWPTTGAEIVEQFWQGVEQRISEGIPYNLRGV